jgi:hypothetical protein
MILRRARLLFRVALWACFLSACGTPQTPRAAGAEEVLLPDPARGYVFLAFRAAPHVKAGTLRTADDADTLRQLWRDFAIPGPVPEADFATYEVVFFGEYDRCYGGDGWHRLSRLWLRSDGQLEPEFVRQENETCEEAYVRFKPTMVYVLAVRRDRLPRDRPLALGPARHVRERSVRTDPLEPSADCRPDLPPPAVQSGEDAILSVPEPGHTKRALLGDGTPVFVVRHADGGVDVFASETMSNFDAVGSVRYPLHGLRAPVTWDCVRREFWSVLGRLDAYGVPIFPWNGQSLDRYRAVVLPDGSVRISPGARMPGYIARAPQEVPPFGRYLYPDLEAYERIEAVDLATARTLPAGTRVKVQAALVLGGGVAPRLCDTSEARKAKGYCTPALGVTWASAQEWAIGGPFEVRVTERGLSDVGGGTLGVPFDDQEPNRWTSFHLEGTLAGFAGVGSRENAVGGEASLSGRISDPKYDGGYIDHLWVGEDWGVALRGRWLASLRSPTYDVRLGVAAVLDDPGAFRDWVHPSVLGAVSPEVGVALEEGRAFPYLAWSFPVAYHFEGPQLRKHPYGARDVLGVRVSPTIVLSFHDRAPDVMYGGAVGISVW